MVRTHLHPGAQPGSISAKILVRLTPRSSRNEVAGREGDEYRIRVTSPPVDGLANQALVDFLWTRLYFLNLFIQLSSGYLILFY